METLDAEATARLLHLHVKRVQLMARTGKLPASRVGRKWLFRRQDIEALVGGRAPRPAAGRPELSLSLSARNRLRGTVERRQARRYASRPEGAGQVAPAP